MIKATKEKMMFFFVNVKLHQTNDGYYFDYNKEMTKCDVSWILINDWYIVQLSPLTCLYIRILQKKTKHFFIVANVFYK